MPSALRVLGAILLLLMAMGFFTAPWSSLMPIFAAETFSGDSRTFGFLIGAVGLAQSQVPLRLLRAVSVRGLGRVVAVNYSGGRMSH